jgi:PAS domain S-box-containing protein
MAEELNLLLVEDDDVDRMAFERFVRSRGLPYGYAQARTVAEARGALAGGRFDVIIADFQLSDGTALDLLESHRAVPLIITTGSGDEKTAARALKAGALDYLIKDQGAQYLQMLPATVEKALERKQAERLYRMHAHALMSINDSVFITDPDDTIIFVNRAFSQTYGYEPDEIVGRPGSVLWGGDLDPGSWPALDPDDDVGWSGEIVHRRKDGRQLPVSLTRSVVRNESGDGVAVVGVARDITARKRTEEQLKASLKEKEVLLKEIHHRVKNNLQVVSSLLNLQSGTLTDEHTVDALRDSQNRVKSMALIHERLYQSTALTRIDFGEYVRNLVSHIKGSFRGVGDIEVLVDVEDLLFDVDVAIPCGLIVNELVSNSIKHAFAPGEAGTITIRLRREGEDRLALTVGDDGKGFPEELDVAEAQSLGLQLVSMLTQQLRGELSRESGPGSSVKVSFPI